MTFVSPPNSREIPIQTSPLGQYPWCHKVLKLHLPPAKQRDSENARISHLRPIMLVKLGGAFRTRIPSWKNQGTLLWINLSNGLAMMADSAPTFKWKPLVSTTSKSKRGLVYLVSIWTSCLYASNASSWSTELSRSYLRELNCTLRMPCLWQNQSTRLKILWCDNVSKTAKWKRHVNLRKEWCSLIIILRSRKLKL